MSDDKDNSDNKNVTESSAEFPADANNLGAVDALTGAKSYSHLNFSEAFKDSAAFKLAETMKDIPALKLAEEWRNSPAFKLASDVNINPALKLAEGFRNSQAFKLAVDIKNNPALKLAEDVRNSPAFKLAEDVRNSPAYRLPENVRSSPAFMAAETLNSQYPIGQIAESLKALSTINFPYDSISLAARSASLFNFEAISKAIGGFVDASRFSADNTKIYSLLASPDLMGWWDSRINSALLKHMSSHFEEYLDAGKFVELESEVVNTLLNDASVVKLTPSLEAELVGKLEQGSALSEFSDKAKQYIVSLWPYIYAVLEFIALLMTYEQYIDSKLESAKSPAEIRAVVRSIPAEHRELMEDERIVIKESVILRAGPDKKTEELGRMKMGTRLEVKGERGFWIRVSIDQGGEDVEGWVYAPFTVKL